MRTQPKLFNEIMGQFDFIDRVEVYRATHDSDVELHFTLLHEEAHRKAVSSTTYGKVQALCWPERQEKPTRSPSSRGLPGRQPTC